MNYITTTEQGRALPELDLDEYRKSDKSTVGISGDHLIFFLDADGETKEPVWFKGKWHKATYGTTSEMGLTVKLGVLHE